MKLSTSLPLLVATLVFSATSVVGVSVAGDDATSSSNTVVVDRDLQQSCDTTAAYHPDYSLPWSQGKCIFTTTCNSPSYATQLACCKEAYSGQTSNFCISQLDNPPTSSPTKTGGPDVFYPNYDLPWPEGKCINTVPVPSGRPTYTSQLACCKAAYGGQVSNACLNGLATPPTGAPTKAGAAGTDFYPDYSLAWPEGKCINTKPIPSGRPTYTSQLACCKAAYGGQVSNACIKNLPSPPTGAPTKVGGPNEYFPDYTLPWPEGKCINTVPVPSGRPTYTSQLACCQAAYGGQVSQACMKKATATSSPTSTPVPPVQMFTINIKITTDDTPGNASWSLDANCNDPTVPAYQFPHVASPVYAGASTTYTNPYSVAMNCCYSLSANDVSFEVTFTDPNAPIISSGSVFDTTGTFNFGMCD